MRGRKSERLARLADTVAQRKFLHIRDAAALLNVSEMTVRRDVAENPALFGYFGGHIVQASSVETETGYELASAADSHAAASAMPAPPRQSSSTTTTRSLSTAGRRLIISLNL